MLKRQRGDRSHSTHEFKLSSDESFRSATFVQRLSEARQAAFNSKNYTPLSYKVGDTFYLSTKLFTDSSSTVRLSQKLSVRRLGPFKIKKIINKNDVRIELQDNKTMHSVIFVENTARAFEQSSDIGKSAVERAHPYID